MVKDPPAFNMPALLRRSVIFAAVDGLVLQQHGSLEPSTCLKIDYKTQNLASRSSSTAEDYSNRPHLESHGIVGENLKSLILRPTHSL